MCKKITFVLIFLNFFSFSFALENLKFLSLKNEKVNVRYGPGFDFPIKFIYVKKYLPVKIIDTKENFRRIIDHKKNSGWIHVTQLRKANSIIVLEDKIVFKKNSKFSEPIIKVKKGRLVLVEKCLENWCNIKTDKYDGWLENDNVWGLIK
jgi:SH3-like domain-containing protein|tara:strand:- start:141 stop:590 length:450 start_codon:yes stop_codon:yes gene_type:complete